VDLEQFKNLPSADKKVFYEELLNKKKLHQLQMEHRCQEDVKINIRLWKNQRAYLSALYTTDKEEVHNLPIMHYLEFKAKCAALQEKSKWKVNITAVKELLTTLYAAKKEKEDGLRLEMPKVDKRVLRGKPAKPYKKDGTLSTLGAKWQLLLRQHNLPIDYEGEVAVVVAQEEPNPASHTQIKDWLFSLGWKPATFDYKKEDDGSPRLVPQVRGKDKLLCPSVVLLIDRCPAVELLQGLSVINHRISILEGFVTNADEDGFVKAEIQGLTNTLRFKHKTVVNLPGVEKPYGKEIRGALMARRQDYELVGSDMSSLEDMTKRHYMHPYDPDYVKEMSSPDYDPHLDLAVRRGVITQEDAVAHVRKEKDLSSIRKPYKAVNYSAVYGVGKEKLARELGITEKEAKDLLDTYWKRNWSIKKLVETLTVKVVKGQMWLLNPVSKFWYSLRYEKDRFSTLNQGTGVFAFDTWLKFILSKRPQLTGQMHDEIILEIVKGNRDKAEALLKWAIDETNKLLKLNVKLDVSIQFGDTYGQIH